MYHLARLWLPADTPMVPQCHADDRRLPRCAHDGRPHARKSGGTIVILGYNAHNDTYRRDLEYRLDRKRVE